MAITGIVAACGEVSGFVAEVHRCLLPKSRAQHLDLVCEKVVQLQQLWIECSAAQNVRSTNNRGLGGHG